MIITGLTVIYGENVVPPGYTKIPIDLNTGAGGEKVYLCYATVDTQPGPGIRAIQCAASGTEEDPKCIPPGFTKVPGDLNKGAGGLYVYLSYNTDFNMPYITELSVISGDKNVWPKEDMYRIDQDANEGTGGPYVYICFKNM